MVAETLKLTRNENKPWGFRLSGGKDFGVLLTVQKVNPGSLAAGTGLQCGDAVLAINGQDTTNLRHADAQDAVIKAGNSLEITIERGGVNNFKPGMKKGENDKVNALINQQNSAVDGYFVSNIAQTLTAHSEMIAPGVMGINFMKPEIPINTKSDVYKLVQEEEQNKVKSPTPPKSSTSPSVMAPRRAAPPVKTPPPVAPKPSFPPVQQQQQEPSAPAPLPLFPKKEAPAPAQSQGICTDCGRHITGGFARVGDKLLHDDCFRCSTCGTTLQNTGYININNKLYCEIHGQMAAKVITAELESTQAPSQSGQNEVIQPPFSIGAPSTPPASIPFSSAPPLPVAPPFSAPSLPVAAPYSAPTLPPLENIVPTPYSPPNAISNSPSYSHLPQTPSSSGGLTFRSISPTPYKRISGDFHKVSAPTSPGTTLPTLSHESSQGPLPFDVKPYMPIEQSFSSQQSQMSQSTFQQTSTMTQQSQYQMDYKQVISHQSSAKGTKFVWPPQRPEELLLEKLGDITSSLPSSQPNYSPLVIQSLPAETQPSLSNAYPEPQAPQPFVPAPLPTTFPRPSQPEPQPAPTFPVSTLPEVPKPRSETAVPGFSPLLAPVVDSDTNKDAGLPQAGVPTGAGSRPAPRRGKGQIKEQIPGCRIPICSDCGSPIRGPFVIALSKTWCPDHFHCNNLHCKNSLQDIGFVEEQGQLYCENCYEAFLAPVCSKCNSRIKGDCLNALGRTWHPECFLCSYCHKPFGNSSFYLEDALPYCEKDWNELFTTKCVGCGFAIEAGDRWVEALNNNYHSQCFKCSICSKNLEGQSFYAKGGKPFCKAHAR